MSKHAVLAPSSAKRWKTCVAAPAMEYGKPDRPSRYADEGTAAHTLAAWCLTEDRDTGAYAGRVIDVRGGDSDKITSSWTVDESMQIEVQKYVDAIRQYAEGNLLFIEEPVDFSRAVGVPNQFGTSDAPIVDIKNRELQIHDLKYGMGIRVDAKENDQEMTYALGVLERFELVYHFERVRLVIHQPRLGHISEWACSIDELKRFAIRIRAAAQTAIRLRDAVMAGDRSALKPEHFFPSYDNCHFCRASGACPQQERVVMDVIENRRELTLAEKMERVEEIEVWCHAVRAQTQGELYNGRPVPGWMLVEGRKGDRKWADETKVERVLKSISSDEDIYTKKLISPAVAEKRYKKSPTWERLLALITQAEGKPHVARASEGRESIKITPIEDDFKNLDEVSPWSR